MKNVLTLLVLAGVAAAAIAWWCMASGIEVGPDSVIYLSAANSLIAGNGLKPIAFHYTPNIPPGQPLVTFPPVYPLLLSLSRVLSADPLPGAKWLHVILFGANVFLVGMFAYLGTGRSISAAIVALLLFLTSARMLDIQTAAMSEAPFILFTLLAAILLLLNLATPRYLLLIGAALAAGLVLTTRYVGITILPPMLLAILLLGNKNLRSRVRDCVIVLVVATLPLAAWLLRDLIVADTATNRLFSLHPIGSSDINRIAEALLGFCFPFLGNAYLKIGIIFLVMGLVIAGVILPLTNRFRREQRETITSGTQIFASVFIATYLTFLIAHNSFIEPLADLDSRVLSPVYVLGLILTLSVVYRLCLLSRRRQFWWAFLIPVLLLVPINARYAISLAVDLHHNGSGYSSRAWANSSSMEYVRDSANSRTIYSNGIDAIHFLTGAEALRLPARFDPSNRRVNPHFEQSINSLHNELMQNGAVVVYFDKVTWRWYLPTKDELETVYRLPVLIRFNDGVVYGTK